MRLWESQEAVVHAIRVDERSRDHAPEVNAQRYGSLYPFARRIKEEILTAWNAHEAVTHTVRIREISRSDSQEIGCVGECALKRACPGAPHMKGGESAICKTQEGVHYIVRI